MSGVVQALLAAYGAAKDAYFKYVTLLLPGNGTNGAQNNTFLDSSTNNFTITRNGNTTQGTFTPYGSNWSNYFDGTGDYLNPPNDSANSFGTGDFTVEAWIYPTSTSSASIVSNRGAGGADTVLTCAFSTANGLFLHTQNTAVLNTGTNVTANTWQHVAFVRASGTLKIYLNGVSVGSASMTQNLSSTNALYIAKDGTKNDGGETGLFSGYISNTRIVKGTAVYTANFTPPTAPLAAITNTSLLTCQSNRFVDNSANNFAITVNGDTSVQRFSPFNPTTPYAAGTIGGSGYFDGTGDFLNTPSTGQFAPSGDFTISCWYYPTSTRAYQQIIGNYNGSASTVWIVEITSGTGINFYTNGTTSRISGSGIVVNAWNYLVLARSGSTITGYVNGVSVGTYSQSGTFGSATQAISIGRGGSTTGSGDFGLGYIADVKLIDGSAITTVPTAPQTATSGTSLLLNMTNGGIIDNAMMNDLETVGNAQISTSVSKFGGGSLAFDGTGDYLLAPSSVNWDFGTGDFTVEFWINFNSVGNDTIIGKWGSGAGKYAWVVQVTSSNLIFYTGNNGTLGTQYTFAWSAATSTWYHVAVTRNGTSLRAFINGTQIGTTQTNSDSLTASGAFCCIGENLDGGGQGGFVDGYIDDLRITRGYARYTANFTPPTAAFPTQ